MNKEKLHFHINDILMEKKKKTGKRDKEKGIFLPVFELLEEALPFKDVAQKRKDHRISC